MPPPTVFDPHVAPNPIDAMSDVDALRTIMAYLQAIAPPAAQLPQAQADVAALFPPLQAPAGGGGPLISPLEEAFLPVQETYAEIFPQGNVDVPGDYAARLGVIVARLGGGATSPAPSPGGLITIPKGGLTLPTPNANGGAPVHGGDGGAAPAPPGGTVPAKPAMSGWAAATGLVIVAAGAGAIWYMHRQRSAPAHALSGHRGAREGKAKALPRASP